MSSRSTIAIVIPFGAALALAGILAFAWNAGSRREIAPERTTAEEQVRPNTELAGAPAAESRAPAPAEASSPVVPVALPESASEPAVSADPAAYEPDLEARSLLVIRVVNEDGVGVADAVTNIHGMRQEGDRGSLYRYRGAEPSARTDADGRATLEHRTWVNVDGRAGSVDLFVRHPDYMPFRDSSFAIGPGENEVVLTRGSTVEVSAWIGAPGNRALPIDVQVDVDAYLPPSAWSTNPDGSRETRQLGPGTHLLRVRHESAEHGLCFSAMTTLVLEENDWQTLHLELFPAERFVGTLDPTVPRPVEDAHVQVCVRASGRGRAPSLYEKREVPVAPDGSFVVEGLPRGEAQLIALARGWSSKLALPATLEQAGISGPANPPEQVAELIRKMSSDRLIPQVVEIPQLAAPYVVPMEPTATMELVARSADGVPLPGIAVQVSPNVCYVNVGCSMVPWRTWTAETDATGRARIVDVPPGVRVRASGSHPSWRTVRFGGYRHVDAYPTSGAVLPVEIVLEPVD